MGAREPRSRDEPDREWFERFTLRPVPPGTIRDRLAAGAVLETTDVPGYLDRTMVVNPETGVALYRLVQLFGTPNVPGFEAGADQPDREHTTWQYLFEATFAGDDGPDPAFHLSIYDARTGVSTGISGFRAAREGDDRRVTEPVPEPVASVALPDEAFLVGVVELVLNAVEEPVPATYKSLWV